MNATQRLAVITLIAGLVTLAVGVIVIDGWAKLLLVLPLATLIAGLGWANAAQEGPWVREVPVENSSPSVPAQLAPSSPLSDGAAPVAGALPVSVPNVDRDAAAQGFDLQTIRADKEADPLQCPRCGRYRGVQVSHRRTLVRCSSCSAELPLERRRPTLVRAFPLGTYATGEPVDRPTVPVDRPTVPVDQPTILIDSPSVPGQSRNPN